MFSCLENITSVLGEYQMRPIYHQTELGYSKVPKETHHQTEMHMDDSCVHTVSKYDVRYAD